MASTVDAAITNLIALLEASPALAGVTVHDGPPMTAETPEWISVGFAPGDPASADNMTYVNKDVGGRFQTEQYDLVCALVSRSGDEGLSARRLRAIALRDGIAAVLLADGTLTASVESARITSAQLVQEQTPQGASAGFVLRITCIAVISS